MGVLDVKKHLRGENEDTSTWVDEFLAEPVSAPPQDATSPERSRPRRRLPRSPRPSSYGRGNGRKAKGSKSSRRQENAFYLTTLVEEDEEAEPSNLDITDYISKTATVFASLFTKDENMEIWMKFVEMSEMEQEQFLNEHLDQSSISSKEDSRRESPADEGRVPQHGFVLTPTADDCFKRIEERIRKVFTKKRIPMGELRYLEEELLFSFLQCPEVVVISLLPSSFERLMMHGLCQYVGLKSSSDEFNGIRHMQIENLKDTFNPPEISLACYLEGTR